MSNDGPWVDPRRAAQPLLRSTHSCPQQHPRALTCPPASSPAACPCTRHKLGQGRSSRRRSTRASSSRQRERRATTLTPCAGREPHQSTAESQDKAVWTMREAPQCDGYAKPQARGPGRAAAARLEHAVGGNKRDCGVGAEPAELLCAAHARHTAANDHKASARRATIHRRRCRRLCSCPRGGPVKWAESGVWIHQSIRLTKFGSR